MMTEQIPRRRDASPGRTLRRLVDAIVHRFRSDGAELEPSANDPSGARTDDPVTEAGLESFPASDPPSFTPEKST